jgi:hypothetical protein
MIKPHLSHRPVVDADAFPDDPLDDLYADAPREALKRHESAAPLFGRLERLRRAAAKGLFEP